MQNCWERDDCHSSLVHYILPPEEPRHLANSAEGNSYLIQIVRSNQRRLDSNTGISEGRNTRGDANVSTPTVPSTACCAPRRRRSGRPLRSWWREFCGFHWPLRLSCLIHTKCLSVHVLTFGTQTIVSTNPFAASMSPENFRDPWVFDPQRWLDAENKDVLDASQPFSLGSRICLGQRYA